MRSDSPSAVALLDQVQELESIVTRISAEARGVPRERDRVEKVAEDMSQLQHTIDKLENPPPRKGTTAESLPEKKDPLGPLSEP